MPIIYKKGDLFTTNADIIVHGCNCQGVMGSGIAKQIKERFPEAYELYRDLYNDNGKHLMLGSINYFGTKEKIIVNALTQEYYGKDGKLYTSYDAIESCMKLIFKEFNYWKNDCKIAMPKIGCGLGGGDWNIVSEIIEKELNGFEVEVWEL